VQLLQVEPLCGTFQQDSQSHACHVLLLLLLLLLLCRDQWMSLLQLHQGLTKSGVNKPLVAQTVSALRSYGFCCPLDGRMYVPVTVTTLVQRLRSQGRSKLPGGSARSKQHVNVMRVKDGTGVAAGNDGALPEVSADGSVAARCTWMQTTRAVRKGEELVVAGSQRYECNWPGMRA
jgi:hypothetical protein